MQKSESGYSTEFEEPSPLWRAWNPYRVEGGVFQSTCLSPWQWYRELLTYFDKSRAYRSNNTIIGRLLGFSDRIDYNHTNGIGWLLLLGFLDPCPVFDLTGKTVSARIRGVDWKPNGSQTYFWLQGLGSGFTSNWAYVAMPLNRFLEDGAWHDIAIEIETDASKWQYAGNNIHQKDRDLYRPQTMESAISNVDNLHFITVMPTHCANFPSGKFEISRFSIA